MDWKREILVLLNKVQDDKVLRRVWKILLDALRN